jgi:hypothetical protein
MEALPGAAEPTAPTAAAPQRSLQPAPGPAVAEQAAQLASRDLPVPRVQLTSARGRRYWPEWAWLAVPEQLARRRNPMSTPNRAKS